MREVRLAGLEYLAAQTELLQRVRNAHPIDGLYEAAEPQWWWGVARSTDELDQLFWFDDQDRPEAAFAITDFGDGSSAVYTDPMALVTVLPGAAPDWIAQVVERGLAHAAEHGIESMELEVDQAGGALFQVLAGHGFSRKDDGIVECWLDAGARPEVSPLHEGYRLFDRTETAHRPHHMADERRPEIEDRLNQTSMYRPDLDLVVLDQNDDIAAYGLFWYDPQSATGVVEPMRTNDDHQQRGLARHVLTSGIDRLAGAGAKRISIGYEPENPASGHLYRSVGFEPHQRTDLYSGPGTSSG